MFILSQYTGDGKTALLSRLSPLEVAGPAKFEVKVVTRRRFKTVEAAQQYARERGIIFDLDDGKTRSP